MLRRVHFPRQMVLAGFFAVSGLRPPGCARREPPVDDTVRACQAAFELCAPPVTIRAETPVASLDMHQLVELASRQDVVPLAAAAATRLHQLAMLSDTPGLVEMEAAMDDNALLRCRCEGIPTELEKKGIRDLVTGRLPPRELRTPSVWAERIAAQLATTRDLAKRSAMLAAEGETEGVEDAKTRSREADRELCETVHSARKILLKESFETMVALVYRKRATEAGEGSMEIERRTLRAHVLSSSCEATPPIAPQPRVREQEPPAPGSRPGT